MGKKVYFLILIAWIGFYPIEGMKRTREVAQIEEQVIKKPTLERQNAGIVIWNPKSLKALCTQYFIKKLGQATGSTIDAAYAEFTSTVPVHFQNSIKNYFRAYYGWRQGAHSHEFVIEDLSAQSEMIVLPNATIEFPKPCTEIFLPESSIVFLVDNGAPCSTVELYFQDNQNIEPGRYDHALFPCHTGIHLIEGITYQEDGAKLLVHMVDKKTTMCRCASFEEVLFCQACVNSASSVKGLRALLESELSKMVSEHAKRIVLHNLEYLDNA